MSHATLRPITRWPGTTLTDAFRNRRIAQQNIDKNARSGAAWLVTAAETEGAYRAEQNPQTKRGLNEVMRISSPRVVAWSDINHANTGMPVYSAVP